MSPGLRALDVALAATVLLEYGPRLETRPGAADPGGREPEPVEAWTRCGWRGAWSVAP
jgi:hypothetical protein